jgi:regulator of replication initiation timing
MIPPVVSAQIDDLPTNVETLQNYVTLLFGVVGSLTLENTLLRQQLHEAENALCDVQKAAQTSRL